MEEVGRGKWHGRNETISGHSSMAEMRLTDYHGKTVDPYSVFSSS